MLQILLVMNAMLQAADAASTLWFLERGGTEGNPLVLAVMAAGGVGAFVAIKVLLAGAMLLLLPFVVKLEGVQRRHAVVATVTFGLLMSAVVVNNVLLAASSS